MPAIKICTLSRRPPPPLPALARAKAALLVSATVCGMVDLVVKEQTDGGMLTHETEWRGLVLQLHSDLAGISAEPQPASTGFDCSACALAAAVQALGDCGLWQRAAKFVTDTREPGRANAIRRVLCDLTQLFAPSDAVRAALSEGDAALLQRARKVMALTNRTKGLLTDSGSVLRNSAVLKPVKNPAVPLAAPDEDGEYLTRSERLERLMRMVRKSGRHNMRLIDPQTPD